MHIVFHVVFIFKVLIKMFSVVSCFRFILFMYDMIFIVLLNLVEQNPINVNPLIPTAEI